MVNGQHNSERALDIPVPEPLTHQLLTNAQLLSPATTPLLPSPPRLPNSNRNSYSESFGKHALPPPTRGCVLRLILCRHGETELNARHVLQGSGVNAPLNNRGRRQAALLAARLSSVPLDLVVSSHLLRAKETAGTIATYHPGVVISEVQSLSEISWGVYEGMDAPDLEGLRQAWNTGNFDYAAPGGESPNQVARRAEVGIRSVIEHAIRVHRDRGGEGPAHAAVVAHGRFLRIALSLLLHQSLHFMSTIAHFNCNVNVIDVCLPESGHNPMPLHSIPRDELERISETIMQSQSEIGFPPRSLASTQIDLSKAVNYDSLIASKWSWNVPHPECCDQSSNDGIWLVAASINDTQHLMNIESADSTALSSTSS